MIARLRELIDELDKLPDHTQAEAAARIESIVEELVEQRWEELLDDPRTTTFLERMSHKIDAAITNGEVLPMPGCKDDE